MILGAQLQHLIDVVCGEVRDNATILACDAYFVDPHDDWRLITHRSIQFFNEIVGDVLDGIDGQSCLIGERMKGHPKTTLPDRIDQTPRRPTPRHRGRAHRRCRH